MGWKKTAPICIGAFTDDGFRPDFATSALSLIAVHASVLMISPQLRSRKMSTLHVSFARTTAYSDYGQSTTELDEHPVVHLT
jgi:hypothetical protein